MNDIAFPFDLDNGGQTAEADGRRHLRDLIEQVLFTAPGERVMRPEFGAGLAAMVFAPVDDAMATAIETSALASLQQALGNRAQVNSVQVQANDGRVSVEVRYQAGDATEEIMNAEMQT